MLPDDWVSWAFALGSVAGALVAAYQLAFVTSLHTEAFLNALERLVTRRAFSRARRLSAISRRACVMRIAHHALSLRLEASVLADVEHDYRSAPAVIPFEDRVRKQLEPVARAERRRLVPAAVLATLSALGAVAVLPLLWPPPVRAPHGIAALALLAALGSLASHRATNRGIALALERLPHLVRPAGEMDDDRDADTPRHRAVR